MKANAASSPVSIPVKTRRGSVSSVQTGNESGAAVIVVMRTPAESPTSICDAGISFRPHAIVVSAEAHARLRKTSKRRERKERRERRIILNGFLCDPCVLCVQSVLRNRANGSAFVEALRTQEVGWASFRNVSTAGGPEPTPSSCLKYTYTSDQLCSFTRSAHCVRVCVS
jgi:hypothetical protein